jgi:23S rRNA pseudouridine1911/1915/1917 synthase
VPPGYDPNAVVLTFAVPNELDAQRLDRFVQWRIPRLTRSRAAEIVNACAVLPDGQKRHASDRVFAGEVVVLVRERFEEPYAPTELGVLYEDEAILAIDKPAGLPVHPSATYHHNTLTSLLTKRYGGEGVRAPQIAHRLDKETSGIVVCARPGPDEVLIKRQFESREVEKEYLAIVRGVMPHDEGRIERPMRRAKDALHHMMEVAEDGLEAITRYVVLARRADATLVHLFPKTGRQHQLRVHLAAIGHPILGDKLYGPERQAVFLEIIEEGGMTDAHAARLGHVRHALHAHKVRFAHPRTGARVEIVSPLPRDLVSLWESLDQGT